MAFDYRARGLRTPMHTAAVTSTKRRLQPFMAAPLRPNETVVGMRMSGDAFYNLGVQLGRHVPIGLEVGVYKVPLSALDDEFKDLVLGGAEEMAAPGQSETVDLPGPIAEQGHRDGTALGTKHRPWAGEIGQDDVPLNSSDARYARWVSEATWEVARSYYDLEYGEQGTAERQDFDMTDEAPFLANMIRGAMYSGIAAGTGSDALPTTAPFTTSISEWAERLSITSTADLTYPEYLQQFGVNASRLRTLPEPYLYRRGVLRPYGSPSYWHFGANWTPVANETGFVVNASEHTDSVGNHIRQMNPTIATDPTRGVAFAGDRMGIVRLGTNFRLVRKRRMIIDENSVLLGVYAWWPYMTRDDDYAHHFDMSQMISPAHWGVPTGGLDEPDFLLANQVRNPDGTGTEGGEADADNTAGLRAMNLLNLYLHGDTFCNEVGRFGQYGPFETQAEEDSTEGSNVGHIDRRVDAHFTVKLAIATDMVG